MVNPILREAILNYYPKAKLKEDSKLFPHTEIVHFKAGSSNFVAKLIEEKILNSYSPKQRAETINFLSNIVPRYYSILKKIGIPVPPFHLLVIHNNSITEFSTDLGVKRLDIILKKSSSAQARQLMDKYVKAIAPAIKQKRPTIGFDAAAENFLLNPKNKLIFCDFVPARIKQKGVYIVGFPQPNSAPEIRKGYDRYYNPYGVLRRARIFFLNTNYKLDELFFESLKNNLTKKEYEKIQTQFSKSAEFKLRKMLDLKKFNDAIKIINETTDTDTLREMAAWVFWLTQKQPTPPDIYDLSRLHLHLSADERKQRLSDFRQSIIKVISV